MKEELKRSRKATFSEGYRRNLATQWRSYFLFREHFKLIALPVHIDNLCLYAQFLARSFKTSDAIQNYVNGVHLLHRFTGESFPLDQMWQVKLVLKGTAKLKSHTPRQALPITPGLLLEFLPFLELDNPIDATFWSLFLTAFFCMLRKSNIVSNSKFEFVPKKQLCRSDMLVESDFLIVHIKWSKTIQRGERSLEIPLPSLPRSPLCPVKAFRNMCQLVSAKDFHPAFAFPEKGSVVPVTYAQLQSFLRYLIKKTERDPSKYSSHSFRRGGASWAFHSNVPVDLIQVQGNWGSDAYKKYLDFEFSDRARVAGAIGAALKV